MEQDAERWARLLGLDLTSDELTSWVKSLKDAAGPPLSPNGVMGNLGGIVASRLAREFDVGGPSFTVSAGGRSDSVAIELAVRALRRHELDRIICGGVLLTTDPRWQAFPGRNFVPEDSPTAKANAFCCHVRDIAEAQILKRLDDASADRDRCYAIINDAAEGSVTKLVRQHVGLDDWQFRLAGGNGAVGNTTVSAVSAYQGFDLFYRGVSFEPDWTLGRLAVFNRAIAT